LRVASGQENEPKHHHLNGENQWVARVVIAALRRCGAAALRRCGAAALREFDGCGLNKNMRNPRRKRPNTRMRKSDCSVDESTSQSTKFHHFLESSQSGRQN